MWFCEEVGELSRAIRKQKLNVKQSKKHIEEEFADCLAWLVTLASLCGVKMSQVIKKYKNGCPKCHKIPCQCQEYISKAKSKKYD